MNEANHVKCTKINNSVLKFKVWFLTFASLWFHLAISTKEIDVELTLCRLLKHTPNYAIYQLEEKSNCLSHVKSFGNLICLRDGDNLVRTPHKLLYCCFCLWRFNQFKTLKNIYMH